MNRWKKQIPEGVQDYLCEEFKEKTQVIQRLEQVFDKWGYDRVETPVIEYLDVFTGSHFHIENMFKLIDKNGRILVLRPDITLPIARLTSTKMNQLPSRLCYVGEVFSMEGRKETTQAGIELIGDSSVSADCEVVMMAVSALAEAGLDNIQIELGQVEFFKGLMEDAGLDEAQTEELRKMIDGKNMLGVEMFLKNVAVTDSLKDNLLRLPRLFGTVEILDEAEKMSSNPRCLNAVANLRQIWDMLSQCGLQDKISMDLGMVQSINYYTGIVFRGLTDGIGVPVLTGGRYDNLHEEFGTNAAATGFGADISSVLIALEAQGKLNCTTAIDSVIIYDNTSCVSAFKMADKLRAQGERVVILHDSADAKDFVANNGAKRLYSVSDNGNKVEEVAQ